jgi:hypothetical protein
MARSSTQIIADIESFHPTQGDWRPLDCLLDELWNSGKAQDHISDLLAVFERFPDSYGNGVLWSIVHGLEALNGYETELVRSYQQQPSEMSCVMLRRLLKSGVKQIDGVALNELIT